VISDKVPRSRGTTPITYHLSLITPLLQLEWELLPAIVDQPFSVPARGRIQRVLAALALVHQV